MGTRLNTDISYLQYHYRGEVTGENDCLNMCGVRSSEDIGAFVLQQTLTLQHTITVLHNKSFQKVERENWCMNENDNNYKFQWT